MQTQPVLNLSVSYKSMGITLNVGWFSVNLADDLSFSIDEAQFETTAGDSITVGGAAAVPEPAGGALAALALGAVGLRRKRKS